MTPRFLLGSCVLVLISGCGGGDATAPDQAVTPRDATPRPALAVSAAGSEPAPEPPPPHITTALPHMTPPVTLEGSDVAGAGDDRKARITVRNTSDKPVQGLLVQLYFLGPGGDIDNNVPYTQGGFHPRGRLAPGEAYDIPINSFFMKERTARVAGVARSITFEDDSKWPAWNGESPPQTGDFPLTARFLGLIGAGKTTTPVVTCWNHGDKAVTAVGYRIEYLGEDQEVLDSTQYGMTSPVPIIQPGESYTLAGGTPPPDGTIGARVTLRGMTWDDGSKWKAPLRRAS